MRIIAGDHKGARLAAPKDRHIRPTSDRTREALFNVLAHGVADFSFVGKRVLDLFAGTGALGLEALSRGGSFCIFIDESPAARGIIRENTQNLHLAGKTKIWRRNAGNLGPAGKIAPFDLVFADPPYGKKLGEAALASALEGGWIAPGALVIVEESAGSHVRLPAQIDHLETRRYGATQILIGRAFAADG